jgi:phage recombination protein Bet
MSSNDVAVRGPSSALAIADGQQEFTPKQVAALQQLGVKDASEGDLAVFFHQATRTGLDPFAKQIYMIGRWSQEGTKQTIQTGIDGYRLIARRAADRSHESLEYEDTLWCGPDGVWRDVWLASGPPAAAKVTVLRNGGRFPAIAMWNEYVQTNRNGTPNAMWARMGAGQLAKCAEALALRKAFPQDLSGIYTDEEMGQADSRAEHAAAAPAVAGVERPSGPRPRVVDGAVAEAHESPASRAARVGENELDGTGRDCEAWQAAIAAATTLPECREMWKSAGDVALNRDCDGIPLHQRLRARMAEIKAAEEAAAEDHVDAGEGPLPEPEPADAADGTVEAPLEGELLPPATSAAPVEPEADPEDLRRPTPQRRALLSELVTVLGGVDARDSACVVEFGLVIEDVGTRRLREWLTREQQRAAAA